MANQSVLSDLARQQEASLLGAVVEIYHAQTTRSGILIFWMLMTTVSLLMGIVIFLMLSGLQDVSSLFSLGELVPPLVLAAGGLGGFLWMLRSHQMLVTPIRRQMVVSLCIGGLIYREGRKQQVVPWQQIRSIQRLSVKEWNTPRTIYKLNLRDAPAITLPIIIPNVQALGTALEREMITRRFPSMVADYEANTPIVFPGLSFNQQYVSKSDEKLLWQEVERITIGPEVLTIKERGVSKAWFTAPLAQFPNICVLEALLEHLKEEKTFSVTHDRNDRVTAKNSGN